MSKTKKITILVPFEITIDIGKKENAIKAALQAATEKACNTYSSEGYTYKRKKISLRKLKELNKEEIAKLYDQQNKANT